MKLSKLLNSAATKLALVFALAVFGVATMAPPNADAAMSYVTSARTTRMAALVTALGSGAKAKLYNGTRPSGTSAIAGGNTLLATVTFSTVIGTVSSGVLTVDATGSTQTNSAHVAGTPTFVDLTTSGDVVIMRIDYCGSAPCWTYTGTVVNGQNVTFSSPTITDGNL